MDTDPSASNEVGEHFRKTAEHFVGYAQDDPYVGGFGVLLNYSLASIAALDEHMRDIYGTEGLSPGTQQFTLPDGKRSLMMHHGSYIGECIRRTCGGTWENDPDEPRNLTGVRISFGDGDHFKPFLAIWLRFKEGATADVFPPVLDIVFAKFSDKAAEIAQSFLTQADWFEQHSAGPSERKKELGNFFRKLASGIRTGAMSSSDWDPNIAEVPPPAVERAAAKKQAPALLELEKSVAEVQSASAAVRFAPGELNSVAPEVDPVTAAKLKKEASVQRAMARTSERILEQKEASRKRMLRRGISLIAAAVLLFAMVAELSWLGVAAVAVMVLVNVRG